MSYLSSQDSHRLDVVRRDPDLVPAVGILVGPPYDACRTEIGLVEQVQIIRLGRSTGAGPDRMPLRPATVPGFIAV
jgi:hypothetical protein